MVSGDEMSGVMGKEIRYEIRDKWRWIKTKKDGR
jgi:hypothetical protein